MNEFFVKFYNEDLFGNEDTYSPNKKLKMNKTELLIYCYLFTHWNMLLGEVNLTINDLISWCGYIPDRHKNKSTELFRITLIKMIEENKYSAFDFKCDEDLAKISRAKMFKIHIGNIMIYDYSFTRVDVEDLLKMINKSKYKNLLPIYLYIKSFIYDKSEKPFVKLYLNQIVAGTGQKLSTVVNTIDILEKMGLLYVEEPKKIIEGNGYKVSPHIFKLPNNEDI